MKPGKWDWGELAMIGWESHKSSGFLSHALVGRGPNTRQQFKEFTKYKDNRFSDAPGTFWRRARCKSDAQGADLEKCNAPDESLKKPGASKFMWRVRSTGHYQF